MAALEFFMIYAKAFRRGDGFYPQNAIFQDLMLLCVVWQGIDWLREKKLAKGIAAIAAVLFWPFVVIVFLLLFPQVQEMPIASTVVAFVITSPLPMWSSITAVSYTHLPAAGVHDDRHRVLQRLPPLGGTDGRLDRWVSPINILFFVLSGACLLYTSCSRIFKGA